MRGVHVAVLVSIGLIAAAPISAQDPLGPVPPTQAPLLQGDLAPVSQQAVEQERGLGKTPDDIGALLRQTDQRVDALFSHSLLQPLHDVWKPLTDHLNESAGLDLGMNYTAIYQRANHVKSGSNDAAGGDYDFFGTWRLWDCDHCGPGSLVFSSESRHRLDSIPPADLDTGTIGGTIVTFGRQDFSMVQLYWEQGAPDNGFQFRLGKMDPALIWDGGRYVSSNYAFLSPAYSDTLAMPLPGAGLGLAAAVYPTKEIYIAAGLHDANGKRTTAGFDTFFGDGEYFSAVELGWTPNDGKANEGLYHLTFWTIDARQSVNKQSDRGVALTLEQQVGCDGNVVPFFRYAYAHRGINPIRQNASVGVGFEEIFGQNDDLIGTAFSWERPSDRTKRDQYVFEVFYRVWITPLTHLTPDIQVVMDPANSPTKDAVTIFGLRLRTLF
jgi:porin